MAGSNTPTIDINALKKELGLDKLDGILEQNAKSQREAEEKAQREAEETRMKSLVESTTGDLREKLEKSLELITAMDSAAKESAEKFASELEANQTVITELQGEIKTLMARRDGKDIVATAVGKSIRNSEDRDQLMEDAAFVKALTGSESITDTAFGADVAKAVNSSSSIEVSDEDYETVFSNRILRDIQKRLVVGDLFTELPMSAKLLTMQIEADRTSTGATWVDSANFGTDASTGNEHTTALTNITFSTFKLACKAYMTDETVEDAITPLLGIIRRRLIEAHAEAIEEAFLKGDGLGKPKGLTVLANEDGKEVTSSASGAAAGSLVPAIDLLKLRRVLGRKGTRMGDLTLIVSMDVYYDLIEDPEWQNMDQVGASAAKLQGQVGRIYGLDVVVSEYFPTKAAGVACAVLVYKPDFIVPRQRSVTVEYERIQRQQKDAYYVTQRVNLQRYFGGDNVATLLYAA